jgi:hypothetical protein
MHHELRPEEIRLQMRELTDDLMVVVVLGPFLCSVWFEDGQRGQDCLFQVFQQLCHTNEFEFGIMEQTNISSPSSEYEQLPTEESREVSKYARNQSRP